MIDLTNVKILAVDDEVDLLDIITRGFKALDFEVLKAYSGNEAWKILQTEQVDTVITDVRMEDGTGLELLEKIKKRNPNKPKVFIISGYADFSLEEIYAKGADGLFNKPFEGKTVSSAIRKSLLPLDQCWAVPQVGEKHFLFEKTIKSFDLAQTINIISFGRGGFFFPLAQDFPKEGDSCEFKFCAEDLLLTVRGHGKVRWVRRQKENERQSGVGVEIKYIDPIGRGEFCNWLESKKNLLSYIPRG